MSIVRRMCRRLNANVNLQFSFILLTLCLLDPTYANLWENSDDEYHPNGNLTYTGHPQPVIATFPAPIPFNPPTFQSPFLQSSRFTPYLYNTARSPSGSAFFGYQHPGLQQPILPQLSSYPTAYPQTYSVMNPQTANNLPVVHQPAFYPPAVPTPILQIHPYLHPLFSQSFAPQPQVFLQTDDFGINHPPIQHPPYFQGMYPQQTYHQRAYYPPQPFYHHPAYSPLTTYPAPPNTQYRPVVNPYQPQYPQRPAPQYPQYKVPQYPQQTSSINWPNPSPPSLKDLFETEIKGPIIPPLPPLQIPDLPPISSPKLTKTVFQFPPIPKDGDSHQKREKNPKGKRGKNIQKKPIHEENKPTEGTPLLFPKQEEVNFDAESLKKLVKDKGWWEGWNDVISDGQTEHKESRKPIHNKPIQRNIRPNNDNMITIKLVPKLSGSVISGGVSNGKVVPTNNGEVSAGQDESSEKTKTQKSPHIKSEPMIYTDWIKERVNDALPKHETPIIYTNVSLISDLYSSANEGHGKKVKKQFINSMKVVSAKNKVHHPYPKIIESLVSFPALKKKLRKPKHETAKNSQSLKTSEVDGEKIKEEKKGKLKHETSTKIAHDFGIGYEKIVANGHNVLVNTSKLPQQLTKQELLGNIEMIHETKDDQPKFQFTGQPVKLGGMKRTKQEKKVRNEYHNKYPIFKLEQETSSEMKPHPERRNHISNDSEMRLKEKGMNKRQMLENPSKPSQLFSKQEKVQNTKMIPTKQDAWPKYEKIGGLRTHEGLLDEENHPRNIKDSGQTTNSQLGTKREYDSLNKWIKALRHKLTVNI